MLNTVIRSILNTTRDWCISISIAECMYPSHAAVGLVVRDGHILLYWRIFILRKFVLLQLVTGVTPSIQLFPVAKKN